MVKLPTIKNKNLLKIVLIIALLIFNLYFITNHRKHIVIHASFNTNCTDTTITGIPETECNALKDIYNSTDGDNWNNNTNWGTNTEVNGWFGITVSNGHVTQISLVNNNLAGAIPASIGNLSYLTKLELWLNNLNGTIPQEIGNLTNLENLYLDQNKLTGSIPSSIGNLSNLKIVHLQKNLLSGTIPEEIASLSQLQEFWIGENNFTFTEIEPFKTNHPSTPLVYSPQNKVGDMQNYSLAPSESITLTIAMPENPTGHDQYQWYKDGQPINGATSRNLTITINSENDYGTYTYKITNTAITDLTLESEPIVIAKNTSAQPPPPPTGILDLSTPIILTGLLSTILIISVKTKFSKQLN